MSTTLPAPASPCTGYCLKHPQARVVGVCSTCLANKLASLIHSTTAFAPEILDSSCARSPPPNSPPASIDSPSNHHHSDRDRLQTIAEEAESSAQGINSSTVQVSFAPVEGCEEGKLAGHNSSHSKVVEEQISCSHDVVHAVGEEKPRIDQHVSLISDEGSLVIKEEVRPINLEEEKPKANPYLRANKPIKCKRSKSLCALRGESLIKIEHEARALESAAAIKGDQIDTCAKKVTLQSLFQLDDEENWRDAALLAPDTPESARWRRRFSADDKPTEEEIYRSTCDARTNEEAKDVCHDNHTHSHRCVPSASALSSSVCPSMPSKLKHSALLNSLLCRKTGDDKKGSVPARKPCLGSEASRTIFVRSFHEGGQASDDDAFIRATYIASESREASLRRCKSKLERLVARSSVSSQPASPPSVPHGVDVKSERKFNLSARALAAEFPALPRSSTGTAEGTVMSPPKSENLSASTTQIENRKAAQDLSLDGSIAVANDVLARLQSSTGEACAALVVLNSRDQRETHLAHNSSVGCESGEAMEMTESTCTRAAQADEELEPAEMSLSEADASYFLSNSQAWAAADTMGMRAFIARAYPEEVQKGSSVAGEKAAVAESRDGIPTYITVEEGSEEAVGGRSLSFDKTIAGEGQQGMSKLPEKGGVWEAYSSKSGKGVRRWPSSSGTGKIAPAQSGLLRFYLTPLRASGRTRFTATRRPPKRKFWPLIFL